MLPPAPRDVGRLSDVFGSAIAAVGGSVKNALRLPKARHSIVVLVDGLGFINLQESKAYARFLNSLDVESIRCEFPSTTATSLSGLATGERSSVHGMIGYSVFDRENQNPMNLLTGWTSRAEAKSFKKAVTFSEAVVDVEIRVIGPGSYKDTGFTAITMPEASYLPAESISERFALALKTPSRSSATYLYVPELDQLAHKFGVESNHWLAALEELDGEFAKFNERLPEGVGVLITADHGVIDVPLSNHVVLDGFEWYSTSVKHTAGDPRCNFLYLESGVDSENFAEILRDRLGSSAFICNTAELRESRWADWTSSAIQRFAPDLVIIWNSNAVGYDKRTSKPQHLKMIGQHGGVSDAETRVPLIRLGCF